MEQHIIPHKAIIKKEDRQKLNGHGSFILWFTGLPGSGKSTLAHKLEAVLYDRNIRTYVLDGDNIRKGLNKNLGFTPEDRQENIRRIGEVARLFMDCGIIVLIAFISPYRKDREAVRNLVGKEEFIEIYAKCPAEVCKQRDVKGLYKKVQEGIIKNFTGISAPYEEPEHPEITIHTDKMTLEESLEHIVKYLEERNY